MLYFKNTVIKLYTFIVLFLFSLIFLQFSCIFDDKVKSGNNNTENFNVDTNNKSNNFNSFNSNYQSNSNIGNNGKNNTEIMYLSSWDCPENWAAVEHEEFTDKDGNPFFWCQPPPLPRLKVNEYITPLMDGESEDNIPVCEPAVDGTYPVLGKSDCQPFGTPCPDGEWPEVPGDLSTFGNIIYVKAHTEGNDNNVNDSGNNENINNQNAQNDNNDTNSNNNSENEDNNENDMGSIDFPFNTIGKAVNTAVDGDVVLIGEGTYDETVTIDKDLSLIGLCVQKSKIFVTELNTTIQSAAVIITGNAKANLFNLEIGGNQQGILINSLDAFLKTDGVWINNAARQGILAYPGKASINNSIISGTKYITDGDKGTGIYLGIKSEIESENLLIENNFVNGIYVNDSIFNSFNSVIRNTQPTFKTQSDGVALCLDSNSSSNVKNFLIEKNHLASIYIYDDGGSVEMENSIIRLTQPEKSSLNYGMGIQIHLNSMFKCKQCLIDRNLSTGVIALNGENKIEFNSVILKDTGSNKSILAFGNGLSIKNGSSAEIINSLIQNNKMCGVCSSDENTNVILENTIIYKTTKQECAYLSPEDPNNCVEYGGGAGLGVLNNSNVSLSNSRILNSDLVGLQIVDFSNVSGNNLEISYNPVGLNLFNLDIEFDFFKQFNKVKMKENSINVVEDINLSVPVP